MPALRVVLALPLVLILPGYAITATFPRQLGTIPERLLFSVALSLAAAIIGGLVLNWTPWGLQANTWVVWLGGITLAASAIAIAHRREPIMVPNGSASTRIAPRDVVLIMLTATILLIAIGVARTPATQQNPQGYTAMWALPASDTDRDTIQLGLRNLEFSATAYHLQIIVDGTLVREWPMIKLEQGQEWKSTIRLPTVQSGIGKTELLLFRRDAPNDVYRSTVLWRGQG